MTQSNEVVLRGARHPLLEKGSAVPIDLELGALRALVISGPNTGGKTVALKTLGLAAALYQCGLRPPADEASLPVFDAILVDIGDEQSIAMSLSTFSAHVRNLIGILELATSAVARSPRRARRRHRPGRGRGARRVPARDACRSGAADGDDEPLRGAEGVGERRRRRGQRRHRHRPRQQRAALQGRPRPPRDVARAADGGAARPPGADRGGGAGADRAGAAARRGARRRGGDRGPGGAGGARGRDRRAGGGGGGTPEGAARRRGAPGRDRARAVVGGGRAAARSDGGRGGADRRAGRARGAAGRDPRRPQARARARTGRDPRRAEEGGGARPQARRCIRSCGARLQVVGEARRAGAGDGAARSGRPGRGGRARRPGHDRGGRRRRGDSARPGRPPHPRAARPPSSRPRRSDRRISRPNRRSRSGR